MGEAMGKVVKRLRHHVLLPSFPSSLSLFKFSRRKMYQCLGGKRKGWKEEEQEVETESAFFPSFLFTYFLLWGDGIEEETSS